MRKWQGESYLIDGKGERYALKDAARCEHSAYESGVRAVCGGFGTLSIKLHTLVEIMHGGELRMSFYLEKEPEDGIRAVAWPPAFSFGARTSEGYTVLPRMQGIRIPAQYEKALVGGDYAQYISGPNQYEGIVFERDAYMPMFGQTIGGVGYTAIFDTPYDARYVMEHAPGGDTLVSPLFVASLGHMRYRRTMLYTFADNCDYTQMVKVYRRYVKERGRLVTLDMKIAENPNISKIIGTPVIHERLQCTSRLSPITISRISRKRTTITQRLICAPVSCGHSRQRT